MTGRGRAAGPGVTLARAFVLAALAVVGVGVLPGSALAQQCPPPAPAAYDTGGEPRAAFPNDPLLPKQWGLGLIKAGGAWARGAFGEGAVVAVIDSGVDLDHPDLAPNLLPGADLASGGPGQPPDCPEGARDALGHGTLVAGIVAAVANNGIGVVGVAPRAKLIPIAVGDRVETYPAAVDAIRYAADRGADVIQLSFNRGRLPLPSQRDFESAIDYAWAKGSVIVSSAGNDSLVPCEYPAAAPHAICVAAVNRGGGPTLYSSLPIKLDLGVTVRAPGGTARCESIDGVFSTADPRFTVIDCGPSYRGYDSSFGTSFAAPHVSGVAAMLAGMGLDNARIVECIRRTSSNRGRWDPIYGYGVVDAAAATAACTPAEPQPPSCADRRRPLILKLALSLLGRPVEICI
jgi:serine protease